MFITSNLREETRGGEPIIIMVGSPFDGVDMAREIITTLCLFLVVCSCSKFRFSIKFIWFRELLVIIVDVCTTLT